jgi:hypothetical protein
MKLIVLFYFIMFAAVSNVMAGPRVIGNGGNLVVCGKKLKLLDYFEAETLLNLKINLDSQKTVEANLETLLLRLKNVNPKLANHYSKWWQSFYNEAHFINQIDLNPINDSFHIAVPKDCHVEQVVVQQNPEFPGDFRYTINKDLWSQLDSISQAGLIFHEIAYRELIQNRSAAQADLDSVAVRHLNGYLASDTLARFSPSDLVNIFDEVGQNNDLDENDLLIQLQKNIWVSDEYKDVTSIVFQYRIEFISLSEVKITNTCNYKDVPQRRSAPTLSSTLNAKFKLNLDTKTTESSEDLNHAEKNYAWDLICGVSFKKGIQPFLYDQKNQSLVAFGGILHKEK